MKKLISLLFASLILLSAAACSNSGETSEDASAETIAKVLNPLEYSIYTNIFYNDDGGSYVGKEYTKDGIFTILHDSFSNTNRYYVWGYSDETLCCDWQWEFVPASVDDLPPIGSRVKVSGKFMENEAALDGYWMENASVEPAREYESAIGAYDMTTMSPTLARVQLVNMVNYTGEYNGKPVKLYGRVMSGNKIQHPYYDNTWELPLEYSGSLPSIGSWITVTGKFSGMDGTESKIIADSVVADS